MKKYLQLFLYVLLVVMLILWGCFSPVIWEKASITYELGAYFASFTVFSVLFYTALFARLISRAKNRLRHQMIINVATLLASTLLTVFGFLRSNTYYFCIALWVESLFAFLQELRKTRNRTI